METGIIKKWESSKGFGFVYAPGGKRFYLHISKVVSGTPELFRRVTFEVGAPRHPAELAQALEVVIGDLVESSERGTAVRS